MRILVHSRFRVALLALVLLAAFAPAQAAPLVTGVDSIGITVSDMDRSVAFYSEVLTFEKVSDIEVWGSDYERLQGLFGLRMRVVRMRLGEEHIELVQYLAPRGRPNSGGLAQQRPLVPAHRHHRERHGAGLRAAARAQGGARLHRPAAAA